MTMMDDDLEADNAKYAALEEEMSQPDDNDSWSGSSRADDDGDAGGARAAREYEASEPSGDDEIERASLQADEWEYQQRAAHGQQQQQPRRDLYDDPVGALAEVQHHLAQQHSQQNYREFLGTVEQAENVFRAQTPDYTEAVEHLEKGRRAELARMFPDNSPAAHVEARRHGYRTPKELRDATFVHDAQTVARQALQQGRNPAQLYYELSIDRGWKPKGGGRSGGGRSSGGRSSGGRSSGGVSTAKLMDLYADNPEEFDRQFDKMARTGALG